MVTVWLLLPQKLTRNDHRIPRGRARSGTSFSHILFYDGFQFIGGSAVCVFEEVGVYIGEGAGLRVTEPRAGCLYIYALRYEQRCRCVPEAVKWYLHCENAPRLTLSTLFYSSCNDTYIRKRATITATRSPVIAR